MNLFVNGQRIQEGGRVFAPSHHSLRLEATGPAPGETISITARLIDDSGDVWSSTADFYVDRSNHLDIAADTPFEGTYRGADPSGLFWSVQPEEGEGRLNRDRLLAGADLAPKFDPLAALQYHVSVNLGVSLEFSAEFVRPRLSDCVTVEQVAQRRLRGQLFTPTDKEPIGAVLVLGGSEGGIVPGRAAALAAEGFVALALGYFDYMDRPAAAVNLPIEYFGDALKFLQKRAPVCRRAIWGGSRGSEAAFLTALYYPSLVDAVIGWVPSHVVHGGFNMTGGEDFSLTQSAMWTYGQKLIHGAPYINLTDTLLARRENAYDAPPGYRYADEFLLSWKALIPESDFHIPVENLNAPLLLVSAEDDGLWPSAFACEQLMGRLKQRHASFPYDHVCLSGAGHAIGMPNEPRPFSHTAFWRDGYSGVEGGFIDYGGTPSANAAAAREGWRSALSFLQEHLR
ncbi:MAG: acyl-CoA thioesterase/bile acid-CoA:amino acid N-acyltransferase family protein [Pseudomonadota bacterium]